MADWTAEPGGERRDAALCRGTRARVGQPVLIVCLAFQVCMETVPGAPLRPPQAQTHAGVTCAEHLAHVLRNVAALRL